MMITEIVQASDKVALLRAANLIKSGEIVAFPTETVYGLGANIYDDAALAKIFLAKGRPSDNPLIVHIENMNKIGDIAIGIPDDFYMLYEQFMPGPLTVVLHKSRKVSDAITAGLDTVAVRFPRHRTAVELIKKSGCPLAAPSANVSTHVSPTSAAHVLQDLDGRIPMIIDGGECNVGIESTVLDMTGDIPVILRPGAVTYEMLKKILKNVSEDKKDGSAVPKSPGMKYKHYSPKASLVLTEGAESGVLLYDKAEAQGKSTAAIVRASSAALYGGRKVLIIPDDAKGYAKNIYAKLREAEQFADVIVCEEPERSGTGGSIMNRLEKAAGN